MFEVLPESQNLSEILEQRNQTNDDDSENFMKYKAGRAKAPKPN